MGARPDRSPGDLVCCSGLRRLLTFVFFFLLCASATDGASLGVSNNAAAAMATGSPAQQPGGSGRPVDGADAFRSSKRRIPKGPDPIHNRYLLACADACMHALVVFFSLGLWVRLSFSASALHKLQF
ncbi:hypothetical protein HU200_026820 [Digitaria exilis]|uniref:Uncharacterized protein n=1 Tax=Digitaria exilis TaxID=1010633 RepID=A0A835ERI2_9POAL|nr:hypothetical protein HU200_026820 [Digitaria exilis]